jgi:hypothetical protein
MPATIGHSSTPVSAGWILLADRGYDTNAILGAALASGMTAVIPPGKNRKNNVRMTKSSPRSVIGLKTPFYT